MEPIGKPYVVMKWNPNRFNGGAELRLVRTPMRGSRHECDRFVIERVTTDAMGAERWEEVACLEQVEGSSYAFELCEALTIACRK